MIRNYSNNSNTSNANRFILRACKKRRSMAISKAKMIQQELGITTNLIALK
ncbi:MAG: hypothetical protein PHX18_04490 [Candidatus Gastranaerophilales bacterium]|nr:hypothetical protein [Candidatus Gastranaerophilales bacterium]